MLSLWRMLRRFWRRWSRGDTIRASPTDRLWLSVEPPCVILWQGERIAVERREEIPGETGVALRFVCLTPRGRETLLVQPGGLHQPPGLEWVRGDERQAQPESR